MSMIDQLKTGPTGSPVTSYSMESSKPYAIHHYLRPRHPDREVRSYDADGEFIGHLHLSDEEYSQRIEAWKLADAEWKSTNGVLRTNLPMTFVCRVECIDGTTGKGIWIEDEGRWLWTEVTFSNARTYEVRT
jgi:hypothetical protein